MGKEKNLIEKIDGPISKKAKSINFESVTRKENFGLLVWSHQLNNYYLANKDIEKDLEKFLYSNQNKKIGKLRKSLPKGLFREIIKLGLDKKVRKIETTSNEKLMSPLELYFDFTEKCNLKCPHCYNRNKSGKITMGQKKVFSVLKEAYEMGIMRVHLAGGEPTIDNESLINYLDATKRFGLSTSMSTNGTLLTKQNSLEILSKDLLAFTVSLDGHNPSKNDCIRGAGSFRRSIRGLDYIIQAKNKLDVDTSISIKSVFNPETSKKDIEEMIKLAKDEGVDSLKLYSPERCLEHPLGFYGGEYIKKYYIMIKNMKELKEKYDGKSFKVLPVINPAIGGLEIGIEGMNGCIGGNELITINPNGDITPCLMMHEKLGNIYKQSLKEFWENSKKLKDYREKMRNKNCESCKIYDMCRGGCQVRKKVTYGKIKYKDPLCPSNYFGEENLLLNKLEGENLKFFKKINNPHSL